MASRKIEDLTPAMQRKYFFFADAMNKAGIDFVLTCTARTVKEQIALYAQGRNNPAEINALRKMAGLPPASLEECKRKVTWTLQSKHLIDLDDNDPNNDKSRAFDIAIVGLDGKVTWDIKTDVNKNQICDYTEIGKIGESVGLRWGGRFKSSDYPHFEDLLS